MIRTLNAQQGFSAVELLITLFIAAAFIATGYQLYSVIIKDGSEARTRASASTIAYDALRRYSAQAASPCSSLTPSASLPANSGLQNASISVSITCPYSAGAATSAPLFSNDFTGADNSAWDSSKW